jgi:hypothetical protein
MSVEALLFKIVLGLLLLQLQESGITPLPGFLVDLPVFPTSGLEVDSSLVVWIVPGVP